MPIREYTIEDSRGIEVTFVEISDDEGNATAMLKSVYDEQQANAEKNTIS